MNMKQACVIINRNAKKGDPQAKSMVILCDLRAKGVGLTGNEKRVIQNYAVFGTRWEEDGKPIAYTPDGKYHVVKRPLSVREKVVNVPPSREEGKRIVLVREETVKLVKEEAIKVGKNGAFAGLGVLFVVLLVLWYFLFGNIRRG